MLSCWVTGCPLYCIVLHCTVLTVLYCTVPYVQLLGYWMFGSVWCDIHGALDVLLCTSSIMNLCLISLDRCCTALYCTVLYCTVLYTDQELGDDEEHPAARPLYTQGGGEGAQHLHRPQQHRAGAGAQRGARTLYRSHC